MYDKKMVAAETAIRERLTGFINWRHNAFHINFENGNHLSTTFAVGSYSDNHHPQDFSEAFHTFGHSTTVEVMFDCGEKLEKKIIKRFDAGSQPIGRLSVSEWVWVAEQLNKEKKEFENA